MEVGAHFAWCAARSDWEPGRIWEKGHEMVKWSDSCSYFMRFHDVLRCFIFAKQKMKGNTPSGFKPQKQGAPEDSERLRRFARYAPVVRVTRWERPACESMMDTCALAFLKEMEVIASKRSDMNSGAKGASDILLPKNGKNPCRFWFTAPQVGIIGGCTSHFYGCIPVCPTTMVHVTFCINICFCLQALVTPCWGLKPVFMLALQEGLQQFILVVNP